ncbi:MAG TPA: DMT family transporter [Burkholderiaceae bacterium]|nr:DMT family transporter [Burkholderiaceae bacterium]
MSRAAPVPAAASKAPHAHRRAVLLMLCATFLWSIAGVVTRHLTPALQAEGRFEITFWRSFFAAVFVAGYLLLVRREGLRPVFAAGWPGLVSGLCWATMYTAFMLALTLTTTANTLVVMSIAPLMTALLARAVLGVSIAPRTWAAIAAAMAGIAWMFAYDAAALSGRHITGMLIAFAVPLASAVNLVTLQKTRAQVDLIPAVFLGGVFSALVTAPLAWPFSAAATDLALLALLGFFQLGLPCMLLVVAARHLAAPELALLALLEVVLGPLWAWLGAGETPSQATLAGGAIVLAALAINEVAALRRSN